MRRILMVSVMCLAFLPGCFPFSSKVTAQVVTQHPVIPGIRTYPGGVSKAEFWQNKAELYDSMSKKDRLTEEDAIAMIDCAHKLDTVLKAREAQIKKYNDWAASENAKNAK